MAESPMIESAIKVLEHEGSELSFQELFDKVVMEMELDKNYATKRIAKMYSDLTLDKRFISLPENKWDLRKRRKLDETLIDTSDIIELEDDYIEDYDDEDNIVELKNFEDEDYNGLTIEKIEYDEDVIEISKRANLSED